MCYFTFIFVNPHGFTLSVSMIKIKCQIYVWTSETHIPFMITWPRAYLNIDQSVRRRCLQRYDVINCGKRWRHRSRIPWIYLLYIDFRRKEGYILCLDEYRGLYGCFVYRVAIMLDNARSTFSVFTMNITAHLETHREAQILIELGKLRFDWSIQRLPERPTQYNLVRCSYVEITGMFLYRKWSLRACVAKIGCSTHAPSNF